MKSNTKKAVKITQFGVVTRDIYDDPDLTTYDIALYGALCSRWNRKTCEPIHAKLETLAADIKSSTRTITRCLSNLSNTGWISVQQRHNASNLIILERYHGKTHSLVKNSQQDSQSSRVDSQSSPGTTDRPSNKTLKQDPLTRHIDEPEKPKVKKSTKEPKSKDPPLNIYQKREKLRHHLDAYPNNAAAIVGMYSDAYSIRVGEVPYAPGSAKTKAAWAHLSSGRSAQQAKERWRTVLGKAFDAWKQGEIPFDRSVPSLALICAPSVLNNLMLDSKKRPTQETANKPPTAEEWERKVQQQKGQTNE